MSEGARGKAQPLPRRPGAASRSTILPCLPTQSPSWSANRCHPLRKGAFPSSSRSGRETAASLYNPPMPPGPIAELIRLTEADIADFEVRMRQVPPAYQPGDLEPLWQGLRGYTLPWEGRPSYWLRGEREKAE